VGGKKTEFRIQLDEVHEKKMVSVLIIFLVFIYFLGNILDKKFIVNVAYRYRLLK